MLQKTIYGQLIFLRVTIHAQHFKHLIYLANTFAIFHHHHSVWRWPDLPKSLTEVPHMSLDVQCTLHDYDLDVNNVCDDNTDIHVPPTDTNESTNIPVHRTGTQIYRLQKQIEEVLGQCRTLAFLTNNIPTCP